MNFTTEFTKFELVLVPIFILNRVLIFWIKFDQKRYIPYKARQMAITKKSQFAVSVQVSFAICKAELVSNMSKLFLTLALEVAKRLKN